MLQLPDHWLWDHWILENDEYLDLFFLRASRALLDPRLRHGRASIGHARSTDALHWEVLPDALISGEFSSFDDRATWTGCAIRRKSGGIRLFYTGNSFSDGESFVQRISWADSDDGITFHKTTRSPLESDPRWYEHPDNCDGEIAWRDPFVFFAEDKWHMLICARLPESVEENSMRRGVVGYASSVDGEHWQVQPPLSAPSRFGHLECLQSRKINGQWYLIFSCSQDRQDSISEGRVWLATGDGPLGPWDLDDARYVKPTNLYAGQFFQLPTSQRAPGTSGWAYTAFDGANDNDFLGIMPDPIPFENLEFGSIS